MQAFSNLIDNFFAFKRVPIRVIILTALASYALQIGTIILRQPLYIITIATLLPWIPVIFFESLWKAKHYHWVSILGVVAFLQLGNLIDQVTQITLLSLGNGTHVCPAPVDNVDSYGLAVDAGLRVPNQLPTNATASSIVKPDANGMATLASDANMLNADGSVNTNIGDNLVTGPPVCGIFGEISIEGLHFVWDIAIWLIIVFLLSQFPRNLWLWIAMVFASLVAIERMVITATFYVNTEAVFAMNQQLWATILTGTGLKAVPVGFEATTASFYTVTGQYGIFAHNGLLGTMMPSLNSSLPETLWLDFFYNLFMAVPLAIALAWESRRIFDFYLAEALPSLSREQLVAATPRLARQSFRKGEVIIKQGDIADSFYIISNGEVEVIFEDDNNEEDYLDKLGPGQYFGEIGLMTHSERMATVRALTDSVEVMKLDYHTFANLMENSEMSRQDIHRVVEQRVKAVREADD